MKTFVIIAGIALGLSLAACSKPDHARERAATVIPMAPAAARESDQFLAGRDWGNKESPVKFSECEGSDEFMRGCRSAIEARRKRQEEEGQRWAQDNSPGKASACQGAPHVALGCRRYYFAHLVQPKPAGQAKYEGMTTAECQAEVNANYELARELDLEQGNLHSIDVTWRRNWQPELQDCENYDRIAAFKAAAGR